MSFGSGSTMQVRKEAHFHIHWNGNGKLDWECFETREAANEQALYLKREDETFQIDEVSQDCPLRKKFA
jgi:hypothetical protein